MNSITDRIRPYDTLACRACSKSIVASPAWIAKTSKGLSSNYQLDTSSLPLNILGRMRCIKCGEKGAKIEKRVADFAEVKLMDVYSITASEARLLIESRFQGKSMSLRITIYNQINELELTDDEKGAIRLHCSPMTRNDGSGSGGFVVYANTDGQ